jgi:hypothetical protein
MMIVYDIRGKLSVPEQTEPDVASIQTDPAKTVEIRHSIPLRGGFEALSKKVTIRFTSYQESNPK